MFDEDVQTIVIDNGSYMCKAGFASEEAPHSVFPSIVGRPKNNQRLWQDIFIGNEALSNSCLLDLKYPIKRGIITNWDDMEKIWHYEFYNQLHIDPTEHPILLTESYLTPARYSEKMISLMFDEFNVPAYYTCDPALLSLYSAGHTTGIVLEAGEGNFHIFPAFEGRCIKEAISRLSIGGCDITDWMAEKITAPMPQKIVRDIKEKTCYVAYDFDEEMEKGDSSINTTYRLPDETDITIGRERFLCPELLFKPYLNGIDYDGIHQKIFDSIMKCDINLRKDLFQNITISGGSTLFKGFAERLEKEIRDLTPQKIDVKIITPENREFAAWVGGSIIASLATFPQMVITVDEYNENGPSIVLRKKI